jgi:hypothetical protein
MAEEGCNDDLAMCLVIFSWLVAQEYFKEMTNNDVRKRIYEEQKNQIEQDMSPFGFIDDGFGDEVITESDTGERWIPFNQREFEEYSEMAVTRSEYNIDSLDWNLDEYGDVSNEWDYMWKN